MALLVQRKTLFAVLVVFFAAREAHAQFGDQYGGYGGMGGKPTPCPKFKCPEGQTPLPRVGMSVHSTGYVRAAPEVGWSTSRCQL